MRFLVNMSVLLLSFLELVASIHQCPEKLAIAPCTCQVVWTEMNIICEKMVNISTVIEALQGKFSEDMVISLYISQSSLLDLDQMNIQNIGVQVKKLYMDMNDFDDELPANIFEGMKSTQLLTITDANITAVPASSLAALPDLRSLSLANNFIENINDGDFLNNRKLRFLVMKNNYISDLGHNPFPYDLFHLHLGYNQLQTLNRTIRGKNMLEWLFLNDNQLESLENELPSHAPLYLLNISANNLSQLPPEISSFYLLEDLFAHHNQLEEIGGVVARLQRLKELDLSHNNINSLAVDEFQGLKSLQILQLSHNNLTSLDSSLENIPRLKRLLLSWNKLSNFSLQQISTLKHIKVLDLGYNKIQLLTGIDQMEEESHGIPLRDLHLEFNSLTSLDEALSELKGLQYLNLSHNSIEILTPRDFLELGNLRTLDLSFNYISSLEFINQNLLLPSLNLLILNNNAVTEVVPASLHNLPAICHINLQSNAIVTVKGPLLSKSKCINYEENSVRSNYLACQLETDAGEISLETGEAPFKVEWPPALSSKCKRVTKEYNSVILDVQDNPLACPTEINPGGTSLEATLTEAVIVMGIPKCDSSERIEPQLNEMDDALVTV